MRPIPRNKILTFVWNLQSQTAKLHFQAFSHNMFMTLMRI